MKEFIISLYQNIEKLQKIIDKIKNNQPYIADLKQYIPSMNQIIQMIFNMAENNKAQLQINNEFVIQVLKDTLYGIEHEDPVFLQDVLQYGVLEIYKYIIDELEDGIVYE